MKIKNLILVTIFSSSLISCHAVQSTFHDYKYKAKYGVGNFPDNGKSIVELDIYNVDESNGDSYIVNTQWRRINKNGGAEDPIWFTSIDNFSNPGRLIFPGFGRRTMKKMIEPGFYFLDRFDIVNSKHFVKSPSGGWNSETGKVRFLAFEVKEKEEVSFPAVKVQYKSLGGNQVAFKFELDNKNKKFIIGRDANGF